MQIDLMLSRDFERCLEDLKKKYGEDFEYINGLHPSQLDFSEFIDNFIGKDTLADASIDPNANANHKDIRSFMTEKAKSEDKLFGLNKIFSDMKKMWGLRTAKQWLEQEYSRGFYLNDSTTASYFPYCFSGDTKILTKDGLHRLDELVGNEEILVLNKNREWEKATVEKFGKQELVRLTLERRGITKEFMVTKNHKWFVRIGSEMPIIDTDDLALGMRIPFNTVKESADKNEVSNDSDWIVVSVEETGIVDDVYCAVAKETHSFTLDGNVLTHNCWAQDFTRLATEGLFFLGNYNNEAPKHLTTYFDDVIEFVSFLSNRQSGAVGMPNILIWAWYFWKKDVEDGYYMKDPDYYLRQQYQKLSKLANTPFPVITGVTYCG